jgi:hypothetical protein
VPQLAATIRTPVLASLVAISSNTTVCLAALTSRSWSTYAAQR